MRSLLSRQGFQCQLTRYINFFHIIYPTHQLWEALHLRNKHPASFKPSCCTMTQVTCHELGPPEFSPSSGLMTQPNQKMAPFLWQRVSIPLTYSFA